MRQEEPGDMECYHFLSQTHSDTEFTSILQDASAHDLYLAVFLCRTFQEDPHLLMEEILDFAVNPTPPDAGMYDKLSYRLSRLGTIRALGWLPIELVAPAIRHLLFEDNAESYLKPLLRVRDGIGSDDFVLMYFRRAIAQALIDLEDALANEMIKFEFERLMAIPLEERTRDDERQLASWAEVLGYRDYVAARGKQYVWSSVRPPTSCGMDSSESVNYRRRYYSVVFTHVPLRPDERKNNGMDTIRKYFGDVGSSAEKAH